METPAAPELTGSNIVHVELEWWEYGTPASAAEAAARGPMSVAQRLVRVRVPIAVGAPGTPVILRKLVLLDPAGEAACVIDLTPPGYGDFQEDDE